MRSKYKGKYKSLQAVRKAFYYFTPSSWTVPEPFRLDSWF